MKDTITVLGQDYKLLKGTEKQYPVLKDANGYVDLYAKKIIIDETFGSPDSGFKTRIRNKSFIPTRNHSCFLFRKWHIL